MPSPVRSKSKSRYQLALLRARSMAQLARLAQSYARSAFGIRTSQLRWGVADNLAGSAEQDSVLASALAISACKSTPSSGRPAIPLCAPSVRGWAVFLIEHGPEHYETPAWRNFIRGLRACTPRLLSSPRLRHRALERRVAQRTEQLVSEVRDRERSETLQRALFRIAELSGAPLSLAEFYAAIHGIVGELLYAKNFFIALLDETSSALRFPYAADEQDDQYPTRPLRKGLTEYVLRHQEPLLATPEQTARLIAAGEVQQIGTSAQCWLGVPLMRGARSLGALVVQSYTEGIGYTQSDQELLTFVSLHVAGALERKHAQDSLRAANVELSDTLQHLRQTQGQLVEAEKMAALGGLVAGVAHEINTPLGVSLTAATHFSEQATQISRRLASGELRRSELDNFAKVVVEATDLIVRNLQRANELVRSFKQVAVDQTLNEPRQVEMGAAIRDILAMLGPALRKTPHRVVLSCPAPVACMLPSGLLYPIISNLVMNAIHHAFLPDQRGVITLSVEREAEEIVLRCSDDGVGMAEATRLQVFEPFFTTRRGQGGTGLGLHILYNLVAQALRGSVRCVSSPGNGSCFELRWPHIR